MRQADPLRRQPVFLHARHLPESEIIAIRKKHWVVAEALVAARWPDQRAIHTAFELLNVAVRPCNAQRGHELGTARLWIYGSAGMRLLGDPPHGSLEILVRACPTSRMDAGGPRQR